MTNRNKYQRDYKQAKLLKSGDPIVVCAICGYICQILHRHLIEQHGLSKLEYEQKFPGHPIMTEESRASRGSFSASTATYLTYKGKDIDQRFWSFLTGTLLGDGSLEMMKRNARYAEGGSNKEYLYWKNQVLSEYLPCAFTERLSSPHTKSKKQYLGWWVRTTIYPVLTEWLPYWYQPHKIVPKLLVEKHLDAFALAVWFCDDGHRGKHGSYIYTMAFSDPEVKWLIRLLEKKFQIVASLWHNKKGQPFIYIPARCRERLRCLVEPFKIPGMEYKYVNQANLR